MDHTGTDSPPDHTLTAYEFAMEEVSVASSKLARALLARTLTRGRGDPATLERECSQARSVYEKTLTCTRGCGSTTRNAPRSSKSWGFSGRGLKNAKPRTGNANPPVVSSFKPRPARQGSGAGFS